MRRADDSKPNIRINVYNASQNSDSPSIGFLGCCGVYHSGIEINGSEYSFGSGVGVYDSRPGDYGALVHSETFVSSITNAEVRQAIDKLRHEFQGNQYHIILKNCNSFTHALILACTRNSHGIPPWINRAAWWASWFKPFFFLCGIEESSSEQQPLMGGSSIQSPPRQTVPMFEGEGVTLNSGLSEPAKTLTTEEQRAIRLRNLGGL